MYHAEAHMSNDVRIGVRVAGAPEAETALTRVSAATAATVPAAARAAVSTGDLGRSMAMAVGASGPLTSLLNGVTRAILGNLEQFAQAANFAAGIRAAQEGERFWRGIPIDGLNLTDAGGHKTFCVQAVEDSYDALLDDTIDWRDRIVESSIATPAAAASDPTEDSRYTGSTGSAENLVSDGNYQLYVSATGTLRVSAATATVSGRVIYVKASGQCSAPCTCPCGDWPPDEWHCVWHAKPRRSRAAPPPPPGASASVCRLTGRSAECQRCRHRTPATTAEGPSMAGPR
jgi:hypothetical protein